MSNLDLSLYRSIEALADNDIPNPILRIDFFLHAVITGEECNIEPVTKTEEYLYVLATGDESRLGLYGDSISLLEEYLEALRTGDTSNLREPRTREEIILYQAITGEDLGVEPVSRIETYLSMLQNAGGLDYILSTSTSASVIPLTNSINGKARVEEMCGDTLVNCAIYNKELSSSSWIYSNNKYYTDSSGLNYLEFSVSLKPNTPYTVFFDFDKGSTSTQDYGVRVGFRFGEEPYNVFDYISIVGSNKFTLVPSKYCNRLTIHKLDYNNRFYVGLSNIILLEGDWTNREIPSEYFEGMKSCGQDDENGHKIEILSQSKNLFNESEHLYQCSISVDSFNWGHSNGGNRRSVKIPCKPNTTYTFSKTGGDRMVICSHDKDFDGTSTDVYMKYCYYNSQRSKHIETYTFTTHSDSKVLCIYISLDSLATNIQLEESSSKTNYVVYESNKKEIQLPQPLRGLPNGVQDRIVYLDESTTPIAPEGKGLYLEKNVGEIRVLGKDIPYSSHIDNTKVLRYILSNFPSDIALTEDDTVVFVNCNLLPPSTARAILGSNTVGISSRRNSNRGLCVAFDKTKISSREMAQSFLDNNNFLVQYPLDKPTLAKISDVNFECYENATVYVDSGAVAPTKTVIRYPYKQPALFSL